jgi:hypothetical protein
MNAIKALLVSALFVMAPLAFSDEPTVELPAGVTVGMKYDEAKARLATDSWQVSFPSSSSDAPYPTNPEIECGQGLDVVCSAGFQKGKEFLALTIAETPAHVLLVSGSY